MSTRRDLAGPLQLAATHALLAHRALGRMSVSTTPGEFSEATGELLTAARGVSQAIAVLARGGVGALASERRRAFTAWFTTEAVDVLQHPMQVAAQVPPVYVSRAPAPVHAPALTPVQGTPIGRLAIAGTKKPRPEDFYFEGADTRPAIVLCAEYLERVTSLLDRSRATLRRLGLG